MEIKLDNKISGTLYLDEKPLLEITDLEPVTVEMTEDRELNLYVGNMNSEISGTINIPPKQIRKIKKLVPKGMRNKRVLDRDGYLDQTNAEN